MAVVFEADDSELTTGLHVNEIFSRAHARLERIQKANLTSILGHLEALQIDNDGRGLIISYNPVTKRLPFRESPVSLYPRIDASTTRA